MFLTYVKTSSGSLVPSTVLTSPFLLYFSMIGIVDSKYVRYLQEDGTIYTTQSVLPYSQIFSWSKYFAISCPSAFRGSLQWLVSNTTAGYVADAII